MSARSAMRPNVMLYWKLMTELGGGTVATLKDVMVVKDQAAPLIAKKRSGFWWAEAVVMVPSARTHSVETIWSAAYYGE